MNKSNIGWLFAVIALSILLIVSIILGVNGYFFSMSFTRLNSDIVVGEGATIEVLPEESSILSFTFDGSYLPNERIPQKLQISAKNADSDVLVRVKAKVFGGAAEEELEFETTENFDFDGEYYYYKNVLGAGGKVLFCDYLKIPLENTLSSKEKYILTIVVESVENSEENQQKWGIA